MFVCPCFFTSFILFNVICCIFSRSTWLWLQVSATPAVYVYSRRKKSIEKKKEKKININIILTVLLVYTEKYCTKQKVLPEPARAMRKVLPELREGNAFV